MYHEKIVNKLINYFKKYSIVDRLILISLALLALSIVILGIYMSFLLHMEDNIAAVVMMIFGNAFLALWLIIGGFVVPALIPLIASIIILIKARHIYNTKNVRVNERLKKITIIIWSILIGSGVFIFIGDIFFHNMR